VLFGVNWAENLSTMNAFIWNHSSLTPKELK
jgi:hypothetical protein